MRLAKQAAGTADDVVKLAGTPGDEFSGDELLRLSSQQLGRVTETRQVIADATK